MIFSLPLAGVEITSPNGGEKWNVGSVHQITWNTIYPEENKVRIEYSIDNGSNWILVDSGVFNDGDYTWDIPYTPSTNCLVRVSDAANKAISDVSDAVFSIVSNPPTVAITSPADNATVFGSVAVKATATDDIAVVRAEFYVDGVPMGRRTTARENFVPAVVRKDGVRMGKNLPDIEAQPRLINEFKASSQFTFMWDATKATAGLHLLRVAAYDGDGGMGHDEVTVQVVKLKLEVQAERREVRAFSIARYYGQIQFTVDNPGIPVAQYRLMRREGSGDFVLIRTITPSELQNNQFQMLDKYLQKDTSYTYRVEAYDTAGQSISCSAEKTI